MHCAASRFYFYHFCPLYFICSFFIWGMGLALLFYKTHNWLKTQHLLNKSITIDIVLVLFTGIMLFIFQFEAAIQIIISIVTIFVVFYSAYTFKRRTSIYAFAFIWILVYVSFFIINVYLISEKKTKTNIVFWPKTFISMVVRKMIAWQTSCSKNLMDKFRATSYSKPVNKFRFST